MERFYIIKRIHQSKKVIFTEFEDRGESHFLSYIIIHRIEVNNRFGKMMKTDIFAKIGLSVMLSMIPF